ncbi:MAG: phosphotransferase [Gammaproteobacteria bacterium]|nr:phosphotransferase [Gammaproteobacteria bacterium]
MSGSLHGALAGICRFFELGRITGIADSGGCANTNFRVQTDTGRYVIRISSEQTTEQIQSEIESLNLLSRSAFPVPHYQCTRHGEFVCETDGMKAVVTRWMEGEPPLRLSPRMMAGLATTLAALHQVDPRPFPQRTTWWHPDYLATRLEIARSRFGESLVNGLARKIRTSMSQSIPGLPAGIVHGDPWSGNTLFKGEELVGLIDWEETATGHPVYDLAYAAVHNCFPDDRYEPVLFETLVTAYEEVRKLSDWEKRGFSKVVDRIVCTNSLWLLLKSKRNADPEHLSLYSWYQSLRLDRLQL